MSAVRSHLTAADRAVLLLCAAAALPLAGCAKSNDIVTQTTGPELTDADIDRDPMALLPGGMVGLVYVDSQRLVASQFGQKLIEIARARSPVPASAGFDPGRDVSRAYVGFYSMQGADIAAVVQGKFDKSKLEQAAAGTAQTPLGAPVVKSQYAGRSLYTARNVGFVVLTPRTALVGNETAMRRALDRMKEGRVARRIPSWMLKLLETPNAPLVGCGDLRASPTTEGVRQELKFLNGLETVRVLGNFADPGLNLAGTLSYGDDKSAAAGAAALIEARSTVEKYGWIIALLGVSQPIKKLEAQAKGKEAQFIVGVDGQAVGQLLDKALQWSGAGSTSALEPVVPPLAQR